MSGLRDRIKRLRSQAGASVVEQSGASTLAEPSQIKAGVSGPAGGEAGLSEGVNAAQVATDPIPTDRKGDSCRSAQGSARVDVEQAAPRADRGAPTSLKQRLTRLTAARRYHETELVRAAVDAVSATEQTVWTEAALIESLNAQTVGAQTVDARQVAEGVLLIEQRHPLSKPHGRLAPALALDCPEVELEQLCADAAQRDPAGWIFLDTETSGLAGGTGTWIFNLGLARFEGEDLVLRQWLLTRLDAESAMLAAILDELADATLLISYNGKSFDLPLLSARLRLAGHRHGLDRLPHLDLLHPVRRAFATRWPDCRLGTVEERLLGVCRTKDLPGAEAPGVWRDWLQRQDGRRLGAVLHHNRLDLMSLVTLMPALLEVRRTPWTYGADLGALARERLKRSDPEGALACLEGALLASGDGLSESWQVQSLLMPDSGSSNSLDGESDGKTERLFDLPRAEVQVDALGLTTAERLLQAKLLRRLGQTERACIIWEELAAQGDPQAIEALAKFLEHQCRDFPAALSWAERLPEDPARTRRCERLRSRLRL